MNDSTSLLAFEATHIKEYAESGPHQTSNGLLLRSDIHKLFDAGYISITEHHKIEVSNRIKEEYQNGKEYYAYHGKELMILPSAHGDQPSNEYIQWHNDNVFRG